MSSIRLKHASGNSMSLAAPGTNPASNLELKLPHTIGSANQLLKVDGSGQLGWATDSTTDSTKLPLAGGTLTGTLNIGNGSITTGSNFSLNGNALKVTGTSTVVGEFKRAGSPTIQCTDTTNNTDLQLRANSTGGLVRTASNTPLVLGTNQQERVRITNTGNLGVNITSPTQARFVVQQDSGNTAAFIKANTGASLALGGVSQPRILLEAAASASDFIIYTAGGSSWGSASWQQRLRITSAGKVLIGTTTPGHANADDLTIGATTAGSRGGLTINAANDKDGSIHFGDNNSNLMGQINYDHNGDFMSFYTGGTKRVRIDSDGIKFGTSATANDALDDYEEGTWTPSCRIETRAASDSPTDAVDGCYTKVGSVVTCHGRFTLNGTPSERSTGRAIEVHGFPFDHNHDWGKVSGDIRVTGHDVGSTYGQDIYFVMRMIPGQQYCRIEIIEQAYNGTRNASVVMQDNMMVEFSFTYVTV